MPPSPAEQSAGVQDTAARVREALRLTARAEQQLQAGQVDEAVLTAVRANKLGVNLGPTWRVFGQALEAQGELDDAAEVYGQAAATGADVAEISADRARLAMRLGDHALAEQQLLLHHTHARPTTATIADLARAQTALMAFDRAQDTLRRALEADAGLALLWQVFGRLLGAQGLHAQAVILFEEALRLDPGLACARDGLAEALLSGAGDVERVLSESRQALDDAPGDDLPALTQAHARRLLAVGRLAEGWDAFASAVEPGPAALFDICAAARRWRPGAPLDGRLLLIGEGDVVDDLLLMQLVPRLMAGGAKVILAVHRNLVDLVQHGLPGAMAVPLVHRAKGGRTRRAADLDSPHLHGGELVAAWAPLRALMATARPGLEDGPAMGAYLAPDAARVRVWRERLAALGAGRKVGVAWRPQPDATAWQAPPLTGLQGPLATPGLHPISLQPAEPAELEWLRETFGLTLHPSPPQLRHADAQDMAAFMLALDVVIGPPGAETVLAAATGAETWFLAAPRHWTMLGQPTCLWFPRARVMTAASVEDWTGAMTELGEALKGLTS